MGGLQFPYNLRQTLQEKEKMAKHTMFAVSVQGVVVHTKSLTFCRSSSLSSANFWDWLVLELSLNVT